MPEIEGMGKLQQQLKDLAKAVGAPQVSVVVGYTSAVALWVHENRQMKWQGKPRRSGIGVYWGPKGRAGFLLDVAREMQGKLLVTVRALLKAGKTASQALMVAGLTLQRESQKNVPVEHGNLRASAFTRVEETR